MAQPREAGDRSAAKPATGMIRYARSKPLLTGWARFAGGGCHALPRQPLFKFCPAASTNISAEGGSLPSGGLWEGF